MNVKVAMIATGLLLLSMSNSGSINDYQHDVPYVSSLNVEKLTPDFCVASWYGGGENLNELTASGEKFNPSDFTVASWDHPFGTVLTVWHEGASVDVTVNDRGPNRKLDRCLDLSKAAFDSIASLDEGLVEVIYTIKKEM